MTAPEQKDPKRVLLRLVDPDVDPEAPVAERIKLEETVALHKKIREKGKLPLFVQDAMQQLSIVVPTPQDVKFVEGCKAYGVRCCGTCRHYDYAAGQQMLDKGGGAAIVETMGPERAGLLGDWKRYGLCGAEEATITAFEAPSCANYAEVKRNAFGRILGGVWRRARDI